MNGGTFTSDEDRETDPRDGNASRVEQLSIRVEELEAALAAAQRRSDAWLSTVSHDLRGPLTLIIGHGDQLLHRSRVSRHSSRRIAELESILLAARRLDKMVTQVVKSAHLEERRLAFHPRPTDLAPVIREAGRASLRRYPTHSLRVEVPASLPLVACDPSYVETIVSSLLSNAAVFSPEDSPIELRAGCLEGRVELLVADSGVGLSSDERQHIFEPRFRPERALHARREGLGVSLWIARELAILSGGALRVESPGPDLGTTMSLDLPTMAEGAAGSGTTFADG
jgi:signal transduction histidine kinase